MACLDVTTSIRDRDTNLGPVARSTVWWPNKRPARVQLAKILPGLISVTYQLPPAYVAIVQLSKVASIPPRFNATIIFGPNLLILFRRPLLLTSYRNSLLFTPLSALGCDFCGTVREIWRNPISDLAKSIPRLEIQRLVPGKRLAVPLPPPSMPPVPYIVAPLNLTKIPKVQTPTFLFCHNEHALKCQNVFFCKLEI